MSENERMWSPGNKVNVTKSHLPIERAKFALLRMVSAGVYYGEGEKVNGEFASTSCCRL